MKCPKSLTTMIGLLAISAMGGELAVTEIKAEHRNGQTFVTWKDAAEGEAGAKMRYSVYRSDKPITQANLAQAKVCITGILNNTGQLFGWAWRAKDRLNPDPPTVLLKEGGEHLPKGCGVGVVTVGEPGKRYYAVVATQSGKPVTQVIAGKSATTEAIDERPGKIKPIKIWDSKTRKGPYIKQTCLSGKTGLPLMVKLHASGGYRHAGRSTYGDYYVYFSRPEWGWRQGLPGVFAVQERRYKGVGHRVELAAADAILHTGSGNSMETYWFGYVCVPQGAEHKEPRAYNFTEERTLWIIKYTIEKYGIDPMRVYCSGGSMGAWGTTTFALRHPEIFAAIYPNRPRTRQRGRPSLVKVGRKDKIMMADGKTDYFDRMDMTKFVTNHPADLPFYGWCCGRRDGFASWAEQIAMVKALTAAKHGFAFAWNDGNHSSGAKPMGRVSKYYPWHLFAKNKSYPAFGNSSIDNDMGDGDPKKGDMEGGINLGFKWSEVVDKADKWSVKVSNELCKAPMTVDITPRRCQAFKPKPGEAYKWRNSTGGSGEISADANGLVTVTKVELKPGSDTVLTLTK